ncbi:protein kinase domain-containing protein [Dokdonella sp.]|uniref:protein kinase domain-containing protein n=1 Tax=Dokdonella sp. TaxID=2291710 RepID=UPI002F3E1F2E
MDARRFQQVGDLFDAVVALPVAQRWQRLHELCSDPQLQAEVEALLRADEHGDSFEAEARHQRDTLAQEEDAFDGAGHTFGAWRVLREVGRGGMGVVYLAERDGDGFIQRGALKLIKRGMDSEPIIARFLRERRLLAQLDHPAIARLLDGGMSMDGRPFLVMDYVDGLGLDDHVRTNAPGLRQRLRLFLEVCAAVAYAHRQLIVHSDIKPSNVRVTRDGTVKLLDFGVAKLLDGGGGNRTATQAAAFTPMYAAPEQRRGGAVGTAADVYALGNLLHELLTDAQVHAPFKAAMGTGQDLERRYARTAPSACAAAIGAEAPIPARVLRGDLDIITLRALQSEPERRYASVDALAEDVRRYLDRRPIVARRDSAAYRAYKFAQRHRYALAAASLVVVISVVAAAFSLRQATVAREQATRARATREFLVGVFAQATPDENNGAPFTAHQLLERGERQAAQLSDTPTSQAEMLNLVAGLYWDIGDYERAKALAAQAMALGPAVPRAVKARSHIVMARVQNELRAFPDALQHVQNARALADAAGDAARGELVDARRTEVAILVGSQDYQRAEPLLLQLLDEDRALAGEASSAVADDLILHGKILENSARGKEGIAAITQAVGILRALPTQSDTRLLDALSRLGIAQLHEQDLVAAEPTLRECVELATRLYGAQNIQTWTTRSNLIRVAELAGRFDEAVRERSALLETERAALASSNPGQLSSHAKFLAADYRELGRFDEAEASFRESLALSIQANGSRSGSDSADALLHLGYTLQLQGRYDEAEAAMRESYAITSAHELATSQWLNDTRARLGNLLRAQGRHAEALVELRAAAQALRSVAGADEAKSNPVLANVLAQWSLAELEAGDAARAESIAEEALALARRSFQPRNFRLGASLHALGRAKLALGQAEAAMILLDEALAVRSPPHPPSDPRVLEVQVVRAAALTAMGHGEQATSLRRDIAPFIAKLAPPWRASLHDPLPIAR